MLHRILIALRIRREFDYAPPGLGPEVSHPYVQHVSLECCDHCGGGYRHDIHKPPFDERRTHEIMSSLSDEAVAAMIRRNDERDLAGRGLLHIAGVSVVLVVGGAVWAVRSWLRRAWGMLWDRKR